MVWATEESQILPMMGNCMVGDGEQECYCRRRRFGWDQQALDDGSLQESLLGSRLEASLTESQLAEELDGHYSAPLPSNYRNASQTISWWQARQADFQRAASERRNKMSRGIRLFRNNVNRTIREVKQKDLFRIFG